MSNELKTYVETLDNYDEKNPVIQTFINKISEPIDYQTLLNRFDWSSKWFAELDECLVALGYACRDDAIKTIKDFLLMQIKNVNIMKYNKLTNAAIWNHMEFIGNNQDQITAEKLPYWHFSNDPGNRIYFHSHPYMLSNCVWSDLSGNPQAIELLSANVDKIRWSRLSSEEWAIELLKQNPNEIDWNYLSVNSAAIELLKQNLEKIDWVRMCYHSTDIELLKQNPDKIVWSSLSANPAAIELLKQNPNEIDWIELSSNTAAIELLKQNLDKINWHCLSENTAGIELLLANQDKICWRNVRHNREMIALFKERIDQLNMNLYGPEISYYLEDHKIDWLNLPYNQKSIDLVNNNIAKIDGKLLPHIPVFNSMLTDNPNEINWCWLACGGAGNDVLKKYSDKLCLACLCENEYDYYNEKLAHFNAANHFPCSHLEL